MKKMLSFIMIAALATSGLFAVITPITPKVKSLSATNTSLGSILLKVYNNDDVDATVVLKYNGSAEDAVNEITDSSWKIGNDVASVNTAETFTINLVNGIVHAYGVGDTSQAYQISIVPGPFTATDLTTAKKDSAGAVPLVPTATFVNGGDNASEMLIAGEAATALSIKSASIPLLYHIADQTIATFKFVWNSVPFTTFVNAEGYYTSTSTVNIKTTV